MKKRNGFLSILPGLALSFQVAALADGEPELRAETPSVGLPLIGISNVAPPLRSFLRGEVSGHDDSSSLDANVPYQLAAQKLATGMQLSATEYRNLGVGCLGFESYRIYTSNRAKVTEVYAGSPAEQAGIHRGDIVLHDDGDVLKNMRSTTDQWSIILDRAGTSSNVTLLRHGEPVTLTLVRMNVEDIPDDNVRHAWEKTIHDLGDPEQGAFIIPKP